VTNFPTSAPRTRVLPVFPTLRMEARQVFEMTALGAREALCWQRKLTAAPRPPHLATPSEHAARPSSIGRDSSMYRGTALASAALADSPWSIGGSRRLSTPTAFATLMLHKGKRRAPGDHRAGSPVPPDNSAAVASCPRRASRIFSEFPKWGQKCSGRPRPTPRPRAMPAVCMLVSDRGQLGAAGTAGISRFAHESMELLAENDQNKPLVLLWRWGTQHHRGNKARVRILALHSLKPWYAFKALSVLRASKSLTEF